MALQLSILHESGKQVINLENKRVLKLMEELPFQEVLCVCVCCVQVYLSFCLSISVCVVRLGILERKRENRERQNKFILGCIIMSTSPHVVVNALISIEVNINHHLLLDVLTKPAYTGAPKYNPKSQNLCRKVIALVKARRTK